jgi:simple sugar transport system ATP-binding protein
VGFELAVELRNISKLYSTTSFWANRNVSLDLKKGEILCLAGENGAGKSTLMKILYGLIPPTGGEIFVNGKPVKIHSPLDANRFGIGMVHQHFMLFPELTVAQNVVMGIEPRKGIFCNFEKANEAVARVIEEHHFSVEADTPVSSLTIGQMQQVEILKLFYRDVDILILDEPTAVLTDQEIASLFKTFRRLVSAGKSLILITHKLGEIKQISDRAAIMRNGEMVAVRDTRDTEEEEISSLMMGGVLNPPGTNKEKALHRGGDHEEEGEAVLSFENVTVLRRAQELPALDNVSFTVHKGEVLGFAGVGGNGLGTLEAVLGGFLPITRGRIVHRGEDISFLKTRRLRKRGLAYVPGDRLSVGCALDATVAENMMINRRARFSRQGFLDRKAVDSFAEELLARYRIDGEKEKPVRSLSGGNIQKMILAREIEQYQDYIVFSEPTWGLDVSAGRYIYEEIGMLRNKGGAVILISSNLDEILFNADRILVFYRGAVAAEFPNPPSLSTEGQSRLKEEIGASMLGLYHG